MLKVRVEKQVETVSIIILRKKFINFTEVKLIIIMITTLLGVTNVSSTCTYTVYTFLWLPCEDNYYQCEEVRSFL